MIGAVIAFRLLAQALSAIISRLTSPHREWSVGAVRMVTLLIVVGIVASLVQGDDAAAQSPTPASPTPLEATPTPGPSRSSDVRAQAVGGFVSGTVWDDSKIRNGQFDDNEPGIAGVTMIVERVDVASGPITCTTGTGANINPTDSNGHYRCEGLVDGLYRVTVTIPDEYEATTARQRQVSVTATDGGSANFGLAHLDSRIRSIGGLVFLDCNENGIQDLAVEFDKRPQNNSFEVTLERTDGSNRLTSSTRNARYTFDNLDSGTYVVMLRISDSATKATTSTRREITIGTTFGAVVDFGLVDAGANSTCQKALDATATAVVATATAIATRQGTPGTNGSNGSNGSGGSNGSSGGGQNNLPPATASAVRCRVRNCPPVYADTDPHADAHLHPDPTTAPPKCIPSHGTFPDAGGCQISRRTACGHAGRRGAHRPGDDRVPGCRPARRLRTNVDAHQAQRARR